MFYQGHRCEFPGCKNVLVLDGNMKNQREVCLAKDAGYVSYPGLPGRIKTGCMASPAFKSRFCPNHTIRLCTMSKSVEGTCICTYMWFVRYILPLCACRYTICNVVHVLTCTHICTICLIQIHLQRLQTLPVLKMQLLKPY